MRLLPLLALAYPLLAHAAALSGRGGWVLAAGLVLVLLALAEPLRRLRIWAWALLAGALAGLWWLHGRDLGLLPLYAPPVLLNAFLAWLFGHTLLRGRQPLVERLVIVVDGREPPLPGDVRAYARTLTLAWALLFVAMGSTSLVLAMLVAPEGLLAVAGIAPPLAIERATWSLFANLLNYVFVGAFFLAEFHWRRRRFPEQPHASFLAFMRRLAALGPQAWRGLLR